MQLQIFNVEHGACALLTCDNGVRMLIDCGNKKDWNPGAYLTGIGVKFLNMLAVTNYDEDHVSGFPGLLGKVYVDWLLRNPTVSAADLKLLKSEHGAGPGIEALAAFISNLGPGDKPQQPDFAGVKWQAFWNQYPFFKDENNLSMVLHLKIGTVGILFPGDLEAAGWKNLLETVPAFRDVVKDTTVLVASHHGRESGISTELFDTYGCKPQIVVISDDYHQYDTQKTTEYYRSKCSGFDGFRGQGKRFVLTTRSDGTILFTWTPQACIVN